MNKDRRLLKDDGTDPVTFRKIMKSDVLNARRAKTAIAISVAVSIFCGMTDVRTRNDRHTAKSAIRNMGTLPLRMRCMTNGRNISGRGFRQMTSQFESVVGCSEKKNRTAMTMPPTPWMPNRMASVSQ